MNKGNVAAQRRARKARRVAAGLPREKGDTTQQVRARAARAREFIRTEKEGPCHDCGKTYPHYVMQFDHRRGEKIHHVSKMVQRSMDIIRAEIAKCDLVCANCHAERTCGPKDA